MDQLRHQLTWLLAGLGLAVAGCGSEARPARAAVATHVDSVIPRDVELARFRAGLSEPTGFTGGASNRDALVRDFINALERRDSTALRNLLLSRAEFAYLYYPSNPEAESPYDLSPGLMWFMMDGRSERGLARVLEERGGRPLQYVGYECPTPGMRQGQNTVWAGCLVRRRQGSSDAVRELLFGPIVQRGGLFKFVSYSNKL
jgi:hypothetical protein